MKYLKLMGLAAIAAAALMAFAGPASATTLTGAGGATLGSGTTISAENSEEVILHPPIGDIKCKKSTVSGKTTNAGSATETVKGNIEALTFTECNATVTVLSKGTLEVHTQETGANNNGTLTSNGAEVTVEFSGFHCIFTTNNTDIGTVTGGSPAKFDIVATIPRTGGRSGVFCGSTAQWTGAYSITAPSTLNVD